MNIILQDRSLTLNNVSHSLTDSNRQGYSNDELDLWQIYSGERDSGHHGPHVRVRD